MGLLPLLERHAAEIQAEVTLQADLSAAVQPEVIARLGLRSRSDHWASLALDWVEAGVTVEGMAPLLGAISRAQWGSQWLRQRANKLRHALRPEPGSSPTPAALINDLAELGVSISSVWDLVNRREPYDAAIPVLIEWLRTVDDRVPEADRSRVREGLVRALTIHAARPAAAQVMLDQFRSLDDPSGEVRRAIGNALSVVADDSVFDDLASIVNDRRFGIARQMVVVGLGRSKDPRAVPLLINLLDDDDVVLHAVSALGKLKAPAARSSLGRLLVDRRPPVRKAAEKALDRLPA